MKRCVKVAVLEEKGTVADQHLEGQRLEGQRLAGQCPEGQRLAGQCPEGQRSILLLGGSQQQVIAIETAKRLGYRTVLCDYLPDNPGQHVADVFYQESTTDPDLMLEIARKEGVSGVLAYASDPAALTAAYVGEAMQLPTNPYESVRALSVKHLFRQHLQQAGFPCPKAVSVCAQATAAELLEASANMRFPVVLKPTDSSGSKGVCVIDQADLAAFGQALVTAGEFSRNKILVLEEYIRATFPRVIGGDVFVAEGKVVFWGLMSCLRDEALGGLVPVGERFPTGLTQAQDKAVRQQIQNLVTSLDLRFGEFNVEIIIGEDDVPYFLEFGARAGGNMIPVQLSDLSGVDLVEANVRYAMGDNTMSVDFDTNDNVYCTYVLHADREGTFEKVMYSPQIEPHVYRTVMYMQPGSSVSSFNGANKALGIVFMRFGSVAQMEALLEQVGSHIASVVS